MDYRDHICPACGQPLKESDDVVVCPECATPQHRECWIKNGRCANDDLHSSGFVWNESSFAKSEEAEHGRAKICPFCGSENPPESLHCGNCGSLFENKGESVNNGQNKTCPFCGGKNDSDALHCKYCGAPVAGQRFYKNNPYLSGTGIAEDEFIAGNKATDVAFYVQASSRRYLPKFKKFANRKKFSFNFAAFLFAPYWFFYRKLYKLGIFSLVVFASITLMLSSFTAQITEAANDYVGAFESIELSENSSEEEISQAESSLLRAAEESWNKAKKPLLITACVHLALHVVFAVIADKAYYKKMLADLKEIGNTVEDENLKKAMITRRGGFSPLAFIASLLGNSMLLTALEYIASMINGF